MLFGQALTKFKALPWPIIYYSRAPGLAHVLYISSNDNIRLLQRKSSNPQGKNDQKSAVWP